jgi:hypothetical protein
MSALSSCMDLISACLGNDDNNDYNTNDSYNMQQQAPTSDPGMYGGGVAIAPPMTMDWTPVQSEAADPIQG